MADNLDTHYRFVTQAIRRGKLVPFLGAGVNLCGRPADTQYERGGRYLPNGNELASLLAETFVYRADGKDFSCPRCGDTHRIDYPLDLSRVSEHVTLATGTGPLYDTLRDLFNADYEPTLVHQLLAGVPGKPGSPPPQLIVTTNYDDLLERAFQSARQGFDLISYVATNGPARGKFMHLAHEPGDPWPPRTEARLITKPNEYVEVAREKRTVILKIHGAVDRNKKEGDSFVITEGDYIDFLARADISNLIPVKLISTLRESHFLFLGYGLRDWNLRVILHRIWGEQNLSYKSWAVQRDPSELDQQFWQQRGVEIRSARLEEYIEGLANRLDQEGGARAPRS